MKLKILTSTLLLSLTAVSAHATSLNLRHEFVDDKGNAQSQHKDRLLVSHTFDNKIGFSAEVKWANPKGEGFDFGELHDAGHEVFVNYTYNVTDTFSLHPAYGMDSNPDGVTHKLDLKGSQKLSDVWDIALRYRYGDANKKKNSGSDSHFHQLNLTSGYRVDQFKFGIDVEYKFEQSVSAGYKGDENYLNLISLSSEYNGLESGWVPFVEFAMVSADTNSTDEGKDDFVPRYRVGVKYNF